MSVHCEIIIRRRLTLTRGAPGGGGDMEGGNSGRLTYRVRLWAVRLVSNGAGESSGRFIVAKISL
jgi:hypothetical protein